MGLLPSTSDVDASQHGEPRVVGVDDDGTDAVLDALASDTARTLLSEIYADAATPSALRSRTDLSLQTISYHLTNLEDAGLIRVADTEYSEKGQEMNVYAPPDEPCVVFVGTRERKRGLVDLFKRVFGAGILLAAASVYVFFETAGVAAPPGSGASSGGVLDYGFVAFPLGGLFILSLIVLWSVWTRYR